MLVRIPSKYHEKMQESSKGLLKPWVTHPCYAESLTGHPFNPAPLINSPSLVYLHSRYCPLLSRKFLGFTFQHRPTGLPAASCFPGTSSLGSITQMCKTGSKQDEWTEQIREQCEGKSACANYIAYPGEFELDALYKSGKPAGRLINDCLTGKNGGSTGGRYRFRCIFRDGATAK